MNFTDKYVISLSDVNKSEKVFLASVSKKQHVYFLLKKQIEHEKFHFI